MKAAFLESTKTLIFKEISVPSISDDEVLIKIKEVGLCGSDLHYYNDGRLNKRVVEKPVILGHESSGIIEKFGKNIKHLKNGDRVAIEPGVPCGNCELCKKGNYNECKNLVFISAPPHNGAFAEYIKHNGYFVHKIPQNISFDQAALIEPLSVGYYAVKRSNVRPGDNVCIIGSGPIGLSCLEMAKISGATKIFIADISDYRLSVAKSHGAYKTINVLRENLVDIISEETSGDGVEKVIESSGIESSVRKSLEIVKKCGTVAWLGMGINEFTIPYIEAVYKDINIVGIFRYRNTYLPIIRLIEMGFINFDGMVSHRFEFKDLQKAIDIANNTDIDKLKIIIYM